MGHAPHADDGTFTRTSVRHGVVGLRARTENTQCRARESPMIKQKSKRVSLTNRLRAPIKRLDDRGAPDVDDLTNKINAIGEALAYLIDKKWGREKERKLRHQIKKARG
jgi:hypothetical protein